MNKTSCTELSCPLRTCALGILLLTTLLALAPRAAAQINVTTYHYDNSRTGQNTAETLLTPTNVNVNQFGKLFAMPVDGAVYAEPLYVSQLTIGGSTHNVVFVATEVDSVYAFDADTNAGANSSFLWKASLIDTAHGAAAGAIPVSGTDVGCDNLVPNIGITSTPVIDTTTATMYVEAKSKENGIFVHRLHAIDITTGLEKSPGPIVITATVQGTGDGSSNGQLIFGGPSTTGQMIALNQLNRPGLLLLNGTVYLAFASHCDLSPWHGWLFGYDVASFTHQSVFVTTPNGGMGGIWMSGSGLAADANGSIYLATGNGTFDTTNIPATELGDSILKIAPNSGTLSLLDYFTPFNQSDLNNRDADLGSGGVLLLPDQSGNHVHELVEVSKDGNAYLVDRDQMTQNNLHFCKGCSSNPQIVQQVSSVGRMWGMPAYWNNTVYVWGSDDQLEAYPLTNGLLRTTPSSFSTAYLAFPGAIPVVSANGTSGGIVWAIDGTNNGTEGSILASAVLHAYDANNLSNELYNSAQAPNNRDQAGGGVKFTVPTVVNGKVYIGTSSEVDVYGLAACFAPGAPTSLVASAGNTQASLSWMASSGAVSYSVNRSTTSGGPYATIVTGITTTSYTDTGLANGTTYYYVVSAVNSCGQSGNSNQAMATPVPGPSITSVSPTSGPVGTSVTITGTNFGSMQGSSTVKFNGTPSTPSSWSATSIMAPVPTAATTGNLVVTVSSTTSNGVNFTVTSSGGGWSNGYTNRRTITIDHTKVPNTDQSNFPVLIAGTYSYLATIGNGGAVTNANGYDIIFTLDSAGTNPLAFEQDSYSASTGAVDYWVKVPTVSHTSDTVIYMFYGNSSVITDQSNKTAVWDSNYKGVYHLPNGTALSASDSTSNANNGTINGATATTGEIDGGASFNGSSSYVSIPAGAFSAYPSSGSTNNYPLSFSAWFKTTSTGVILGQTDGTQPNGRPNGWVPAIYVDTSGKVRASVFWHGSVSDQIISAAAYNDGNWHLVEDTYNTGTETLYIDGQAAGNKSFSEVGYSSVYRYFIGTGYGSFWTGVSGAWGYWNGSLDEVRVSNTARSADWISTEYNNQSNPSTFYSVGAAATTGGSPPAPTGLMATPGNAQVSLTWNASLGTVSYNVYGSTSSGGPYSQIATGITTTSYTNMGLTNGTTYYYVVTAVNANGESGYSNQASATPTSGTPWSNGYTNRRTITIDHTKVPNTDQSNFPVLIAGTYSYLATIGNGGAVTNANGYDIIFTLDSAGTNPLAFEQDSYSASTGAVDYWVKVPTVSHTSDTVIYMFYGNSSVITDQSNKTAVWDSNYKGVYHLPNGTALSASDSTSNANNGTINGATATTGEIDGGASFNGSSSYVSIPAGAFSAYPSSGSTNNYPLSFSAWFKTTSTGVILGQTDGTQPNGRPNGWVPAIYVDTSGKVRASVFWHGSVSDQIISAAAYNDGNWHLVEDTYNTGTETLYIDGQAAGNKSFSEVGYSSVYRYFIGTGYGSFWTGVSGAWGYWNGSLDEVRVSNTARSADWISTEYNNQSNPSTFYSVGAAQ